MIPNRQLLNGVRRGCLAAPASPSAQGGVGAFGRDEEIDELLSVLYEGAPEAN